MDSETIAAVASAPGEGAIAVIRLSGQDAFAIADSVFSGSVASYDSHTVHYGKILQKDGSTLDHVLLLVMKNPRSYTGEDTVEIFCHGGSLMTRRILERLYAAGARPAEPGEFSFRAFVHGKIDLAQAEAVQQLIAAKSDHALDQAGRHLEGALSQEIARFQKKLTENAAVLEAWVDFPEEGLEFVDMKTIIEDLETICSQMEQLAHSFYEGKICHEGLSLCLIGAPNVGKSSLMNALLRRDRAIVTPIAGTTRDLLEEDLHWGELHFRLIDTAGIRETEEVVEKEGIARSCKAMREADVVLVLLDATRPLSSVDLRLIEEAPQEKTLVVWNKTDAGEADATISSLRISAQQRVGLDALRTAVERLIWKKGPPSKEEVVITRQRHHQALLRAIESLHRALENLRNGASAEFAAADMRSTLNELGIILGTNVAEDVLSAIFSKFCLGK